MRCDQPGLWGPPVLNVSPLWLEPSCTPRDGSTRCAFGSGHPRLHVPVPCYCRPLLLSLLGTFNEQLGWGRHTALPTLSCLDTRKTAGRPISGHPVLGEGVWGVAGWAAVLPCHAALGHGRHWEQDHAQGRGLGSVTRRCPPGVILVVEQPCCPVPIPVADRVGMWRQGGWHCLGLVQPPFLFAPDMCQGLLGQAPGNGGPGRVSAAGSAVWQCWGGCAPRRALG